MYVPDPPRSSPSRPRLTPQVNHPSSPPFHVKHYLSAACDSIRKNPSPVGTNRRQLACLFLLALRNIDLMILYCILLGFCEDSAR
ncbi:hypothetical protein P168DRAFT_185551 [Aspergillus campestris IBT 28561]|uniref:Uncharacterized protein n=1 Tax=Aspergillus campestris (strain IBT 28561) TaxID=1392248 RepID=A0A2I1CY31_ASPC2|nr:uncharacterized protein P168DRAFT_185551 [Aspergillus campestris IBT 28561]PKY02526.1 hypothetical protein P168DRAFT_185551 [Aspergillus campestris IBT 28561]